MKIVFAYSFQSGEPVIVFLSVSLIPACREERVYPNPDSCSASFLRQMISRVLLLLSAIYNISFSVHVLSIPYKVSYIDSTSAICSVKSVGSLSPFILYAAAIFLSIAYPIVHFQNRISLPKRRKSKGLFRTNLNKYIELTSIFI